MPKGKYGSFSSTKGEFLAALAKLGQRLQVATSEMTLREHIQLQSLKTLRDYRHRSLKNALLRHDLPEVQIANNRPAVPPASPTAPLQEADGEASGWL